MKELMDHIGDSFFQPDLQAARIILATAYAHYIPGVKPVWMFVVGPPSSGKTSITVEAISGLTGMFGDGQTWGKAKVMEDYDAMVPGGMEKNTNVQRKVNESVNVLSTINTNTFISHQMGVKNPGLLEQIGRGDYTLEANGQRKISTGNLLVLVPDFTVMASMSREKRGEVMGQLRRIYDGAFEKKVGTELTKIWEGKMTLLAATTPIIDKYTSIDSSLGERFIQINWRQARAKHGRAAFAIKRCELGLDGSDRMQELVRQLFGEATHAKRALTDAQRTRLDALSDLTSIGRTSVYGQIQEHRGFVVTDVSTPETPFRLGLQFYSQLCGLACLGLHDDPTEQDIQDILRVGIETLPTYRSVVLQAGIEKKPLSAYEGKWLLKTVEATKLTYLEVIEKCNTGPGSQAPIKLTPLYQEYVDMCEFDCSKVFTEAGNAGEREQTKTPGEPTDLTTAELERGVF